MHRLFLAAVILMPALVWGQAQEMYLIDLIKALQQQGHSVVYSNTLVRAEYRVAVDSVDVESLKKALRTIDLDLYQSNGVWSVVRGADATQPPPLEEPLPQKSPLETVIVTGSIHRFPAVATGGSAHSFMAEDMSRYPTQASDAMRVALRLPGISSVGISAKPQIRGGLRDEVLVMQDGVELLEPFHLADYHSAFSAIDYRTIESMNVYTGGFPSRYGNRMSGVIEIQNNWQDDEYATDLGVSTFSNFVHNRGEAGQDRPANWLISVRQGDLTDLADYIETQSGEPKYLDASARVTVSWSDSLDISFGAVYAEDDILFTGDAERASSNIETSYAWSRVEAELREDLNTQLIISWLDFERLKRLDSFEDEPKGGFLDHRQEIQRLALRNDWSASPGTTVLEFGWQAEFNRGDYEHQSIIDRGELADILDTPRTVDRDISVEPDGWSGGSYLQLELPVNEQLTLQPSLRWDFQDYYLQQGLENQLSPRLGLAYTLSENTLARLSIGRYYQPEGIHELQVLDGVEVFFAPQHSDQLVAGIEFSKGELEITAEYYLKEYGKQKGRFENTFNPFVLLPEMEPDRVGLFPGKARAQGVDLDLDWAITDALSGQVRYSFMDAQDRLQGKWVDRRWSQRHTANTSLVWERDSLTLSASANWHSGWRSTQLPEVVADGVVIPVADVLNNTTLRDYFSLDVNARKNWEIGKTRLQIYADISNLANRKNRAGIDFDIVELEGASQLLRDHETLLGRVTSVGITLSF